MLNAFIVSGVFEFFHSFVGLLPFILQMQAK